MAGGMIHDPHTYVVRGFRGVPCRSTQAHHLKSYRRGQELAREVQATLVQIHGKFECPVCHGVVKPREYAWKTILGKFCRGACAIHVIESAAKVAV